SEARASLRSPLECKDRPGNRWQLEHKVFGSLMESRKRKQALLESNLPRNTRPDSSDRCVTRGMAQWGFPFLLIDHK
ncbi:MAG TPA: hypothetical protein VI685_13480, partial [Candidatus Angelobacter sp.]